MTAEEYKKIREQMGLSQAELAKFLGVDDGTIGRRERGELPISPEVELALNAVSLFHRFGQTLNDAKQNRKRRHRPA